MLPSPDTPRLLPQRLPTRWAAGRCPSAGIRRGGGRSAVRSRSPARRARPRTGSTRAYVRPALFGTTRQPAPALWCNLAVGPPVSSLHRPEVERDVRVSGAPRCPRRASRPLHGCSGWNGAPRSRDRGARRMAAATRQLESRAGAKGVDPGLAGISAFEPRHRPRWGAGPPGSTRLARRLGPAASHGNDPTVEIANPILGRAAQDASQGQGLCSGSACPHPSPACPPEAVRRGKGTGRRLDWNIRT
jgi:hypothetical protein